jgi:hypothetical protein
MYLMPDVVQTATCRESCCKTGTIAWLLPGNIKPNIIASKARYPVNFLYRRERNFSSMMKFYQAETEFVVFLASQPYPAFPDFTCCALLTPN